MAVCSSVSGTTRMLIRGIATGRMVPLRLGVPAVGTSRFERRFHVGPVSQGLKLYRFSNLLRTVYSDWHFCSHCVPCWLPVEQSVQCVCLLLYVVCLNNNLFDIYGYIWAQLGCRSGAARFQLLHYSLCRPSLPKHRIVIVPCNWLNKDYLADVQWHESHYFCSPWSTRPECSLKVRMIAHFVLLKWSGLHWLMAFSSSLG